MSQFLSMFNSAGPQAFSQMACQVAPYFSTINPLVTELRANAATVQVPFRREITNHLGTVHAIAMCNAAELAAGMMTDVSIPQTDSRVGARTLVNARIGYEADQWSLSLFANNLFDEKYDQYINDFANFAVIGAPRSVGVVLEAGF